MKIPHDYLNKNKDSWNKKTAVHFTSAFYDVPGFLEGTSSLNKIELDLLGNIKGKSVLHLQCHFGQDSLSLARMGAHVTGVDLSDEALKKANELNSKLGMDVRFICCDVYDLPAHCKEKFDIVFSTYGTIGWLPDLDKWGKIISLFLKPGGSLVFVEFHPVVWMFDSNFDKIKYSYFNTETIIEDESGTYADKAADIRYQTVSWNHGISEVVGGLLKNGLEITGIHEYNYSPYDCFNGMEKTGDKKYRIKQLENKIPMVYAVTAVKKVAG